MRMPIVYIHQLEKWPRFDWDGEEVGEFLGAVRHSQGRLRGHMEMLGLLDQQATVLEVLTQDVLKTSEIEGERLSWEQVRSSLAGRLGINIGALPQSDRLVEGVVEMVLDATQHYDRPLTSERLLGWHSGLFPTGLTGFRRIRVGEWRDDASGPMQVVSGTPGRETIYFEAPPAKLLEKEMGRFLDWFNGSSKLDPVLKAAVAHLWFVTIHPFDDGNGRIARAIADMALTRSEASSQRFYSMSAEIQRQRKTYYSILEQTQKGDGNITAWMQWFLECLDKAISGAESTLTLVLRKASYWKEHDQSALNIRQSKMLNRLLDGYEGKLTTSRWASMTHCSQDTAGRDINDLIQRGLLAQEGKGGRSTSYSLAKMPE